MSDEAELQRAYGLDVMDVEPAFVPFHRTDSVSWKPGDDVRIAVTGAQSTGITTVARDVALALGLPFLSEVARAVFEHGFRPGMDGSMASQSTIWFSQFFLERQAREFVTDRFLLCATAHAEVLADISRNESDITCATTMANATAMALNTYTAVFYTPIEFALVSDGVRDENEDFRRKLDAKVLELFDRYSVPFHTLTGTPERRKNTALSVLSDLGIHRATETVG